MAVSKFSTSTVSTGFAKQGSLSPLVEAEYVVVAGGGGGGGSGGGGGAGGYRSSVLGEYSGGGASILS